MQKAAIAAINIKTTSAVMGPDPFLVEGANSGFSKSRDFFLFASAAGRHLLLRIRFGLCSIFLWGEVYRVPKITKANVHPMPAAAMRC